MSIDAQNGENSSNTGKYANVAGALISLIVFVGVVGWGAQTLLRDSSGVPVVRALDGPMRITPDDPGGVPASHQGLTVNQVSSSQKNENFNNNITFAPGPVNLKKEDQPTSKLELTNALSQAQENSIGALLDLKEISSSSTDDDVVEKLAAILALSSVSAPIQNVAEKLDSNEPKQLRPQLRPKVSQAQKNTNLIENTGDIEIGTQMVQLGAYSNKQLASQAWRQLSENFGDYFVGKESVIVKGKISGQEIYRLRVYGFSDITETRRLCTALLNQNTECYPVVMN